MNLAPLVIFAYNRPYHFNRTLNSILENDLIDKTNIYIFVDGPKNNYDKSKILEIKRIIELKLANFSVVVKFNEENHGLSNSIIRGINKVLERNDKIIVLEDDILVSKIFYIT